MNIYHLFTRNGLGSGGFSHDCAYAFVVIAANEGDARALAEDNHGDEPEGYWLNDAFIELLGPAFSTEPRVVCRDFLAG